ncbi:hypothetical protein [Demequina sp. NBRC 110056]|uniref:hypothetical protein n=1 Tax=Demequina sp. NBRC 110056 TaxID=1570345 RepID=UPI0009FBD2B4|nr:hypothetical protein [Demequina sp. NBRC 110056]
MSRVFVATAVVTAVVMLATACIPSGPDESSEPEPVTAGDLATHSPDATATGTATSTPASASATAREPAPPTSPDSGATSGPDTTARADDLDCPTYDDGLDWDYVAVDSHRFGSICVGMTFAEASASAPGPAVEGEEMCPWLATVVDADPLYIHAITSPVDPDGPIRFFHMIYLDDPAAASPHDVPATAEGVGIGSPAADLAAAYPTAREVTQDDPSRGTRQQVVVEEADAHHYVFDIVDGVVAEVTWGTGLSGGIAGELCAL